MVHGEHRLTFFFFSLFPGIKGPGMAQLNSTQIEFGTRNEPRFKAAGSACVQTELIYRACYVLSCKTLLY